MVQRLAFLIQCGSLKARNSNYFQESFLFSFRLFDLSYVCGWLHLTLVILRFLDTLQQVHIILLVVRSSVFPVEETSFLTGLSA